MEKCHRPHSRPITSPDLTKPYRRRSLGRANPNVGIAHDVVRPAIRQPRRMGGDWVVMIMIRGLAATPAKLSASGTAFGLVGLATGEIIGF
jgi:hypothetical protein